MRAESEVQPNSTRALNTGAGLPSCLFILDQIIVIIGNDVPPEPGLIFRVVVWTPQEKKAAWGLWAERVQRQSSRSCGTRQHALLVIEFLSVKWEGCEGFAHPSLSCCTTQRTPFTVWQEGHPSYWDMDNLHHCTWQPLWVIPTAPSSMASSAEASAWAPAPLMSSSWASASAWHQCPVHHCPCFSLSLH